MIEHYIDVQIYLYIVVALGCLGLFISFQPDGLRKRQFSKSPMEVTPLCNRTYIAWIGLAILIRFQYTRYMDSRALYELTIVSFVVAIAYYFNECFIKKTVPVKLAINPFIVASLGIYLLLKNPV